MKNIVSAFCFFILGVLANYFMGAYMTQGKPIELVTENPSTCILGEKSWKENLAHQERITQRPSLPRDQRSALASTTETAPKTTDSQSEKSPEGIDSRTIDVPLDESIGTLERDTDSKEQFFLSDTSKKLETIEVLTTQAQDLGLIEKILKTEEDANVRKAALNRLNQEQSYAATNILIEALDDPSHEVSLTALATIVANGDRTLLPKLEEKLAAITNESNRKIFEESIKKLEYSNSMDIDNAAL